MRQRVVLSLCLATLFMALGAGAQPSYLLFESGPVRPIALSPDGQRLFVANTPDGYLEIFDVAGNGSLTPAGSVQVGLEPVAVAARTNDEIWVVNHLSDSVSIVEVGSGDPRVTRTLLVGDEPSDIVFAGPGGNRAFVSAAHRGQNAPSVTGGFDQAGAGRADVYVFDATNLGDSLRGDTLTVITLFGDKPRALATNASGSEVYAAIFRSGNRSTVLNVSHVCQTLPTHNTNETISGPCTIGSGGNAVTAPGGKPTPHKNHAGDAAPLTGLILKQDRDGGSSGEWQDELGRDWSALVKFDLPDQDVFRIDANANPPVESGTPFSQVGTTLFNMAVHPTSGKLFVSNTDAQNHVRFEGPGDHVTDNDLKPLGEPASVRGNLAQSRITIIDPVTDDVDPRHLNKHIPYDSVPVPAGVKEKSIATPTGIDFSSDGNTLFVAGLGSGKIGVYDRALLESDGFIPNAADHIAVSGGGPSGLLVSDGKLYVTTRFDNELKVIDIASKSEEQRFVLHNPEPAHIVVGRPFLYDALLTGSNGEAACASCHIFADMDDMAWDLGNPDDDVVANGNPFNPVLPPLLPLEFHPHKGPMTTQSLRGLENMGAQHWRGDRQGGEAAAFEAFNVAFPGLVGRDEGQLSAQQMMDFREFALELRYPPNPIRQLDNGLRAEEDDGSDLFSGATTDSVANCEECHVVDAGAGRFGADGRSTFDATTQHFKVPHLRNLYQKVGMFGFQDVGGTDGPFGHLGDQIRGFGFSHDGSFDSVFRFLSATVFTLSTQEQTDMQAFLMAFPTDLAPIVGQQLTLSPSLLSGSDASAVNARLDLLIQRAGTSFTSEVLGGLTTECEVAARLVESAGTLTTGYKRESNGSFTPDDGGGAISENALRAKASVMGQEVTFTCVPPGSAQRMALDRDEDTLMNGLDNCPAAPNAAGFGTCTLGDSALLGTPCSASGQCGSGGFCSMAQEDGDSNLVGDACELSLLPEPGSKWLLAAGVGLLSALHRRRAHPPSG